MPPIILYLLELFFPNKDYNKRRDKNMQLHRQELFPFFLLRW